ncbi:unnamed protein product [Orchesella dallaii]|uniref:Uncharacterized protein n=1 Tax=Orchesella dallaii TaxID=48710 RepID=A0ABP1RRT8_9HEXA
MTGAAEISRTQSQEKERSSTVNSSSFEILESGLWAGIGGRWRRFRGQVKREKKYTSVDGRLKKIQSYHIHVPSDSRWKRSSEGLIYAE